MKQEVATRTQQDRNNTDQLRNKLSRLKIKLDETKLKNNEEKIKLDLSIAEFWKERKLSQYEENSKNYKFNYT